MRRGTQVFTGSIAAVAVAVATTGMAAAGDDPGDGPAPSAISWQTPILLDTAGDGPTVDLREHRLFYDDADAAFIVRARVDNPTSADFGFGFLADLDRDRADGCLGADLGVSVTFSGGVADDAALISYPSGCAGVGNPAPPEVTATYHAGTGWVSLRVPSSALGAPVGFDWAVGSFVGMEIDFGPDGDLHDAFGFVRPFPDVPTDAYYTGPIAWLRSAGFTTGYGSTGLYVPDEAVTRAQMATYLHRLAAEPVAPPSPFVDVERPSFYAAAVDHLYAQGLTTGVAGTNLYAPHDPVTRGQMVTFLWRAAGEPPGPHPTMSDVTDPAAFYYQAVGWAEAEGITTGYGGTDEFRPDVHVTRGQLATFLERTSAPYHAP